MCWRVAAAKSRVTLKEQYAQLKKSFGKIELPPDNQ
jgi:hypothetical protein